MTEQRWSRTARLFLATAAAAFGAAYLGWRVGTTLQGATLVIGIPLLAAEFQAYLAFLLYEIFLAGSRPQPLPAEALAGREVDVFITTLDEDYEVLAPAVFASAAVTYPHTTWVLDDGCRDWVEALCRSAHVRYLSRGERPWAKAGNLNNGLGHSTGEFIVTLDADFIPAPSIIDDFLGYFDDEAVAVVQGPQQFYNTSSFQHARDGTSWNEQSALYELILPAKAGWNAAYWAGSPAMLRRSALDAVGGVVKTTLAEDIATSIELQRGGWRIAYHDRVVALGVAPETFSRFYRQRYIWARGGMEMLRSRAWRAGLSVPQRLGYLGTAGRPWDALTKLVFLLSTPAYLLFGRSPVGGPAFAIAALWLVPAAFLVTTFLLTRSWRRFLRGEVMELATMLASLRAFPALFLGFGDRGSTPKGTTRRDTVRSPSAWYVMFAMAFLQSSAAVAGVLRLLGAEVEAPDTVAVAVGTAWAALMAALGWTAVVAFREEASPLLRGVRFDLPVVLHLAPSTNVRARLRGISGDSLVLELPAAGDDPAAFEMEVPGTDATVPLRTTGVEHGRLALILTTRIREPHGNSESVMRLTAAAVARNALNP